jgi:hypothetical protein
MTNMILNPNSWSCLPASFAMALGISLDEVFEEVGRGDTVIWSDLPPPHCYEGFHPQQFFPLARRLGYAVMAVEPHPSIVNRRGDVQYLSDKAEWQRAITSGRGVVGGFTPTCGHAVYLDRGTIYDPRGRVYTVPDAAEQGFEPEILWEFFPILPISA